jgi:4-hydroxybenzoate polyprenyltransferase
VSSRPARDLRAFLRCASCRFSALYLVPFYAGLAAAGGLGPARVLLGAGFWLVLTLAIEVTNRLSDRVEDSVNRPERTRLCEQVGWRRLALARAALWAAVAVAALAWLALEPSPLLALLLGLGAAAGAGYSCGPRLSRNRAIVFVILSGTFVGPFTLGWVAAGPPAAASLSGIRALGDFVALFWVLTLFISCLAGVKDVTDRAGDELVGYRSAFIAFAERHGGTALALLATVPFAALGAFTAAGLLPARMLALLVLWPASLVVGFAVRGAGGDPGSQLLVREALYHHWLAFASATVLAAYPSLGLLAAILGTWLCWALATRHLHWGAAPRLADLAGVVRLARGGRAPARPPARVARPAQEGAWGTS